MDTSGFYKLIDGELVYGPNFVHGPGTRLSRDMADKTNLPGGWIWAESQEAATEALGLAVEVPDITDEQAIAYLEARTGEKQFELHSKLREIRMEKKVLKDAVDYTRPQTKKL